MRYNQIPKRTDRKLNFSAYESSIRQNQKLNNIQFDPNYFNVIDDPTGLYVTIDSSGTTGSDFEHHLQGIVTQANTLSVTGGCIEVHGGVWKRYSNDTVNKIPLTVDGGGTSEFYADVATVTDVNSSGYIIGELDDPLQPATLVVRKVDNYPTDDKILNDISNCYSTVVIGFCNVTSNNLTFEQYQVGDIMDEPVIPDSNRDSTVAGFNTIEFRRCPDDGALEIKNTTNSAARTYTLIMAYEDPVTSPCSTLWVPTNSTPQDCNTAASVPYITESSINAVGLSRADHRHMITSSLDADHSDYADTAGYANDCKYSTFLSLEDTPYYYNPFKGFIVRVNSSESGLEFTDINTGMVDHTELDFSGSGTAGVGCDGGNTDHDSSYHRQYNDGVHANFIDDGQYRTTGNQWMAELHVSADGTANSQYWTASDVYGKVSGGITWDASTGGALTLKAKNDSTWTTAGVLWESAIDNAGDVFIGTNGNRFHALVHYLSTYFYSYVGGVDGVGTVINQEVTFLDLKDGSNGSGSLYLGKASYLWANIYFNGVAGVDSTARYMMDSVGNMKQITITKGAITSIG